jgi:hypothetical protein
MGALPLTVASYAKLLEPLPEWFVLAPRGLGYGPLTKLAVGPRSSAGLLNQRGGKLVGVCHSRHRRRPTGDA